MTVNTNMQLVERAEQALRALRAIETQNLPNHNRDGVRTADIAARMDLVPVRRLGNGAVKGTWSGRMDPAMQLASTMRSLHQKGLVRQGYGHRSRSHWFTTGAGRSWLESRS